MLRMGFTSNRVSYLDSVALVLMTGGDSDAHGTNALGTWQVKFDNGVGIHWESVAKEPAGA